MYVNIPTFQLWMKMIMKKFKKGVLAIGVLAAAAVIAAGCGKKNAKTTNETKKEIHKINKKTSSKGLSQ